MDFHEGATRLGEPSLLPIGACGPVREPCVHVHLCVGVLRVQSMSQGGHVTTV